MKAYIYSRDPSSQQRGIRTSIDMSTKTGRNNVAFLLALLLEQGLDVSFATNKTRASEARPLLLGADESFGQPSI